MATRVTDIKSLLSGLGFTFEQRTRHWAITRPGYRPYTIPNHNGDRTEVGAKYLKALCKHFAIEIEVFSGDKRVAKKAKKALVSKFAET